MKLLGVLALVVLATASRYEPREYRSEWLDSKLSKPEITVEELKHNQEYEFHYDGQLSTGIPQTSEQHSATRIQALVSLIVKSHSESLLRLKHVRFGKMNAHEREPQQMKPFEVFDEIEMRPELKQTLEKPVKFEYKDGMIRSLEFDGEEQPWSANIKRGVMNLLQVNLKKEREINRIPEQYRSEQEEKRESYIVMEKSLEGECETLYTVESEPCRQTPDRRCRDEQKRNVLNVTKSIDFERCEKRAEIRYNQRFEQICPSCQRIYNDKERTVKSSSVWRINLLCKDRKQRQDCIPERSEIESTYNFVNFNKESNMITSYVKQTLKLVRSGKIESETVQPRSPVKSDSDMLATLDSQVENERFMLTGEEHKSKETPYTSIPNKVKLVKTLLKKLVHHTSEKVEEEAPRQFARLVEIMRVMKRSELEQLDEKYIKKDNEEISREESNKCKELMIDALGVCGTKDCVDKLVESIEKKHISSIRASVVIRKLMETKVATKQTIEKVMSICKSSERCEKDSLLKQAVYLTAGSMMRTMCEKDTRDKLAIEYKEDRKTDELLCSHETKKSFVERLMKELVESEEQNTQVLVLKTLSNAALRESIKPIEEIIRCRRAEVKDEESNKKECEKYSTLVRVEAVLALRQLVDKEPRKIEKVLLPIFMDREEPSQLRVVCLYKLMQCQPDKLVIDQITRQLKTERNSQVASFTYTYLQTLANSTNPCHQELKEDIKLSLRQGRYLPVRSWLSSSKFLRLVNSESRTHKMHASLDILSVSSRKSIIPHKFQTELNLVAAGKFSPKFISVGFNQHGLGEVLRRVVRSQSHKLQSSLDDLLSGKFEMPSPKFNYRDELKQIFEKLNIESRESDWSKSSESSEKSERRSTRSSSSSWRFEPFGILDMKFKNQEYGYLPISAQKLMDGDLSEMWSDKQLNSIVESAKKLLRSRDIQIPFSVHSATFFHEQEQKLISSIGLPIRFSVKIPTVMQASGVLKIDVESQRTKLSIKDLKPSIVATNVLKVESWSPIVNTGVKIVSSAKIYTPLETSVTVEHDSNKLVEITMSPLKKEKHEIFALRSRPITFCLVWPSQLREWKEPEERTIHGEEINRVHTHDLTFGSESLGIKFESTARLQRTPVEKKQTKFSLMSGVNKYVVTAQPGKHMPKEYVLKIRTEMFETKKSNEKFEMSLEKLLEKRASNEFLHRDSSEEESFEKTRKYVNEYKSFEPTENEIEIEMSTRGSKCKREIKTKLGCQCDREMQSCKCDLKVKRPHEPECDIKKFELESELEVLYPKTPMSIEEVSSDKRLVCRLTSKWGEHDSNKNKIDVKFTAEQSSKMRELKERSTYSRLHRQEKHRQSYKSLFSPVEQAKQCSKYGLLDEIKVDIDYKLEKCHEDNLNWVFRALKHRYYDQTEVTIRPEELTKEGRVQAKLNIDPVNRRYLNVTIRTPIEKVKMIDIPLITKLDSMNMHTISVPSKSYNHWWTSIIRRMSSPVCESRTDRIRTFDDLELDVPSSTCYSVLAKDCSSRTDSKFAVLIKKQEKNTEKKTLKVITRDTQLKMRAKNDEGELECEIDNKQVPCDQIESINIHNDHVAIRCDKRRSSRLMRCELPESGIEITFDGFAADVKVSPMYSSQTCGLCGDNDGEYENEMWNSRRERSNRRSIFESFLYKESESEKCEHEFKEDESDERRVRLSFDSEEEERRRRYNDEPMFDEEIEPIRRRESSMSPIEKTKVIEEGDKICFSTKPVRKCPRNTYPTERHEQPKTVVYTCMPRYETETEDLLREVRREGRVSLSDREASFTDEHREPKKCREY